MQLSTRLAALADAIGTNDTILDIGCDHGILEAALIERDQAHRVIAADISPASLEKARRLAAEQGIEDRVECRLGDGFSVVREDDAIDAAVIAGICHCASAERGKDAGAEDRPADPSAVL